MKWTYYGRSYEVCQVDAAVHLYLDTGTPDGGRRRIMITPGTKWSVSEGSRQTASTVEIVTPTDTVEITATWLIARTLIRMLTSVVDPSREARIHLQD